MNKRTALRILGRFGPDEWNLQPSEEIERASLISEALAMAMQALRRQPDYRRAGAKGGQTTLRRHGRKSYRKWGKTGGRKPLYPRCPRYGSHRFSVKGRCPCGFTKKAK